MTYEKGSVLSWSQKPTKSFKSRSLNLHVHSENACEVAQAVNGGVCIKGGVGRCTQATQWAGHKAWWPRPKKTAGFLLHMQRVKLSLRIQGKDSLVTQHTRVNEAPEVSL